MRFRLDLSDSPASSAMVFAASDVPRLLFGAYTFAIGAVAGFVLTTVPHPRLNQNSVVYFVLAAVSSLHILFCKYSELFDDWISLSNETFSVVSQFYHAQTISIRDHGPSQSSLLELVASLAREWWGYVHTLGPYNPSRLMHAHQRYNHRNVRTLVDGESLHIHPYHLYGPVVLER
jgi:hypothetical protein